jgi:hypothetical protein
MKARVLVLVVLLVLVVVPGAVAHTGVEPVTWSGSWGGSFRVVNLGDDETDVTVTFYCPADAMDCGWGDFWGEDSITPSPLGPGLSNPFSLAAGASQLINMDAIDDDLPNGNLYSVVVSAGQPIVVLPADPAGWQYGSDYYYNGSHGSSVDLGQTAVYLPSVSNDFYDWYSHLSIQNLTGTTVDVTVEFFEQGSDDCIASASKADVPDYSSWQLAVDDPAIDPPLPKDYNGSAVVSADGAIAVINNDYNQTFTPGANQVYSGFPYEAGAYTVYCPALYDSYWGWISSVNVQNVGDEEATVDYWYSDNIHEQESIPQNAALLKVYMNGEHAEVFGLRLESDEPIVAVASASVGAPSQTYECTAAFSNHLYTPVAMKKYEGKYNTAIQVQNLDPDTAADICIEYEGYESYPDCYEDVPGNGVVVFYTWLNDDVDDGWMGPAHVYSTNNLAGVVNRNNDSEYPPPGNSADPAMGFLMLPLPGE